MFNKSLKSPNKIIAVAKFKIDNEFKILIDIAIIIDIAIVIEFEFAFPFTFRNFIALK